MKTFISIFLSFCFISVQATYYYVKVAGGTGVGTSDGSAWSLAKLNTVNLVAGDRVYLKRGDVFYGTLTPKNGVSYSSYGSGANPKFTGLSTPGPWTLLSGNIYYVALDVPSLNVVTLDGLVKGMGRYPNTGFLQYTAHSGTKSLTSGTTLPFNPTGAEIVIRKIRQVTDRQFITAVSGNVYSLSSGGDYGTPYLNNTNLAPNDGNGFFIQSNLNTLDQLGEWYYDKATKRLYMHFGTGTPTGHTVQVSSIQKNMEFDNKSNITFLDIDFEGANAGVGGCPMNNVANIQFTNCNITKQQNGIVVDNGCNGLKILSGSMRDVLNTGLLVGNNAQNVSANGTTFTNIGFIAGAGGSGDAQQVGVWLVGDSLAVKNCKFTNIGFHAIVLHGNNTLIEDNLIDTYGFIKDDCGGVYDFQFQGTVSHNQAIRNNTILNGIGVTAGVPPYEQYGQAAGIYLDAEVNNTLVTGNTIAHGPWGGIMLGGVGDGNVIRNNLIYDFSKGLLIYNYNGLSIRNQTIIRNQFIAKTASQFPVYLFMYANDTISRYGILDSNYYARPIEDSLTIGINRSYPGGNGETTMSLAAWKSTYGLDAHSMKSAVTTRLESNVKNYYIPAASYSIGNDKFLNVSLKDFFETHPVKNSQ